MNSLLNRDRGTPGDLPEATRLLSKAALIYREAAHDQGEDIANNFH
jgi:hypothetical protein